MTDVSETHFCDRMVHSLPCFRNFLTIFRFHHPGKYMVLGFCWTNLWLALIQWQPNAVRRLLGNAFILGTINIRQLPVCLCVTSMYLFKHYTKFVHVTWLHVCMHVTVYVCKYVALGTPVTFCLYEKH